MGEEYGYDSSGRIVYIKSDDGEFVPFCGIAPIEIDTKEPKIATTFPVVDCMLSVKLKKGSWRRMCKQISRRANHKRRIHRHERRLKERMRRARLKGEPWICLRDKDGGQICMSTSVSVGEYGWLTIRTKRKIVWPAKGESEND